jgi:Mlc titration factor MtfA (ptsG expression regulator)/antitoxin component YwqK of YwqJK toxin-antitoxin module
MASLDANEPLPEGFKKSWRSLLEREVAIYRRLPADLTRGLEVLIPWFIKKVKWGTGGGFKLTMDMKVCIAAEACLLIVRRSKKDYHKHDEVIVTRKNLDQFGSENAAGDTNGRRVRLGWYWTKHGMEDGEDNYNVTLHEYAHVIDYANDNDFDSQVEMGGRFLTNKQWQSFGQTQYKRLCKLWKRRGSFAKQPVIVKYGASELCEFFTCATEAFFEVSRQLKLAEPEIYEWLKKIYGLDPAQWPERVDLADLVDLRRRRRLKEEAQRRAEEERRRRHQEQLQRFEECCRRNAKAQRVCTGKISQLEKEKDALKEEGTQPKLKKMEQQHAKRVREIERRYKGKDVQLKRRLREAKLKLERERDRLKRGHAHKLEKIERNLEMQQNRLKRLEEVDLTAPEEPIVEEVSVDDFIPKKSKRKPISRFHPSGLPSMKFTVIRNLKDGLFLRWDKDGNLREEMHYHLGVKNGLCTYYHPSGPKELEGHFANDQRAGTWTGWHEDGLVSQVSNYRNGQLLEWIRHLPDGTVETFKEPSKLDRMIARRK